MTCLGLTPAQAATLRHRHECAVLDLAASPHPHGTPESRVLVKQVAVLEWAMPGVDYTVRQNSTDGER